MTEFKEEMIELKSWTKFLLGSKKRTNKAIELVLNDIAFATRLKAQKTIDEDMTVRSKFALKQIRVRKARAGVGDLFALVGSVRRDRFTGWVEQELGMRTDRNVATKAARSSTAKPIRRSARLAKPYFTQKRFPHRGKIVGRMGRSSRGGNWETPAMLSVLRRMQYKSPFILFGYKKIPPGLYRLTGGKEKGGLEMLQGFDSKSKQPKRNKWMQKSVRRTMTQARLKKAWRKAIVKTFKWGMR